MKYLIQNRKEFAISVGFFVMTAVNLIKAIMSKDVGEELIVAVVYALFGVLGWFYNMPTSEENCIATGQMRQKKAERTENYVGETFYDEEAGAPTDSFGEDDDDGI